MPSLSETARPSHPVWLKLLGVAALGALGAGCGFAVARLTNGVLTRWDDDLALAMIVATLATALISIGVIAARPRTLPKGCGILQITVMLLAAAMLTLPVFGTRFASADVVFGVVLVLLAIQIVANLMLWARADEMLRRIMAETSVLAFWALQTALFVYAAGERLGLVSGLTAWGMIGVLMGVYFIASIIAAARRGIH